MLKAKTHRTLTSLVLGVLCLAGVQEGFAATPLKSGGVIAGSVKDSLGVPQLGATVLLFNSQDRKVQRALTDSSGRFLFPDLLPDHYTIHVLLGAFLPVVERNILVQPGTQSMLAVHLSSVMSTIQISYPTLENGSLMTDDWKWVLRTATATRPVMRFMDGADTAAGKSVHASVFSDTRGLFTVSAGQGGTTTAVANQADMGTAFAVATSLFGSNNFQVSGNVGYGTATGVPAAAFRTSYSRQMMGGSPVVSLTMRQLFLPGRLATAMSGSESSLPMLRTMSGSFDDHMQIADNITLRYGATMDSVTFLDRLNYMSPYAKLTDDLGNGAKLEVTFTSGNARPELAGDATAKEDLQADVTALGLFPRISLRDARTEVQRGEEFEVTYSRKIGSRTYSGSVYHEAVTNAALTLVGPAGVFGNADVLPDLFSDSSTFNAGNFQSTGYSASVTQALGDHISATVMYGSVGGLTVDDRELQSNNPQDLRDMLHAGRHNVATGRIAAVIPWAGTHVVASYQYAADRRWATTGNEYSTQAGRSLPGLNVYIRQPLPGFARRVEATADLRNMLAQGYLPVGMASGQQMMLVETPRSLRGGLAFIF